MSEERKLSNRILRELVNWKCFSYVCDPIKEIIAETEKDLDHIIQEIEHNATNDTLFEKMVLTRLKNFRKEWFRGIGPVKWKMEDEEIRELPDDLTWKDLPLGSKIVVIGFLLLCILGIVGLSFFMQMI